MSSVTVTDLIELDGKHYRFLAGPFSNPFDAYDWIDSRIAYGSLSESDDVIVHDGTIYRGIAD